MSRNRAAKAQSLRMTWITTVAGFVAVIAAVGAIALIGIRHQRVAFSTTSAELQQTTEAMVTLERAMADVVEPMTNYLYRYGGQAEVLAARDRFAERSDAVLVAFDAAADAIGDSTGSNRLAQARDRWASVDAAVRSSHEDVTDADIAAVMEEGADDPFVPTVWEPYDRADQELADIRQATVARLGEQVDGATRTGRLVGTFVFWALLVAIALAFVTARRMSRRVLVPLAELGRAAGALHHSDRGALVTVPHAVAEVQDRHE